MPKPLPRHLKRYTVTQDYGKYSPEDQAVWRFVMRQLRHFLSEHGHPVYLDGLKKSGIEQDTIPKISRIDKKLRKFGWGAVSVSGFIPPAAFMEFQSLGYLPIASEIRSCEHIHYTPAPDIIHEAAGHAPILVDKEYAKYLKQYAEVAAKSIISKEDMDQYEAIRMLSDAKEDQDSKPDFIRELEQNLAKKSSEIKNISEAGYLSRMNWWTAEYGLIGDLENPKIYGAGLLSSPGEAQSCLLPNVKKIPISLDCINVAYDITEPQPQLFVTPDFKTLGKVLEQLRDQMSFVVGGRHGLQSALNAKTVNTIQLDTGLQISGKIVDFKALDNSVYHFSLTGPTILSYNNICLKGHGKKQHAHGFSSPIGILKYQSKCLSDMKASELKKLGLSKGNKAKLEFQSGIQLTGILKKVLRRHGKNIIFTFTDCAIKNETEVLFEPSWGEFDLAAGTIVQSVFGGPADREAYGPLDDFVAKKIPKRKTSKSDRRLFNLYSEVRKLRLKLTKGKKHKKIVHLKTKNLWNLYQKEFIDHWLLGLEIVELTSLSSDRSDVVKNKLNDLVKELRSLPLNKDARTALEAGIKLLFSS